MDSLDQYIKKCKKSLFRFEGLQDYSAQDGEKWTENFVATGRFAELPSDNEWWKEMKWRNQQGIVTQRVRLVITPLTDYTKTEVAYLKEAKKYSGDDIRIVEEEDFKKIAPNGLSDFYLIDDLYVFDMEYGEKGKYLRSQAIEGVDVGEYRELKAKLLAVSHPLNLR